MSAEKHVQEAENHCLLGAMRGKPGAAKSNAGEISCNVWVQVENGLTL
jgi:hypothetical protein